MDALALAASSGGVLGAAGPGAWRAVVAVALLSASCWLLSARLLRQYDPSNGRGPRGDLALTLVFVASIVGPVLVLGSFGLPSVSPVQLGRFSGVLLPTVLATRYLLVGRALALSADLVAVVIVGIGPLGRITGNELGPGDPHRSVLGYLRFADQSEHSRLHSPVLGTSDELEKLLRERVVDEVYFASTEVEHTHAVQQAIGICERFGIPFALPVCSYRLCRARAPDTKGFADGYVHYQTARARPRQLAIKRLIDLAVSVSALVLLSPLLVATALAIKLTSKGPVLFRQQRVGLRGRVFSMLKFRSMVVDAEGLRAALLARNEQSGPTFKMRADPRVTPVGRWIRQHSIDELPQVVNVLRGDMSLVGPRPPLPGEVDRYEGWQLRRLSVRPGLTCVWQVSGRNGIAFEEWMMLDLSYIDHWTLAGDFSLILKTVPAVLTGRGAS